MKQLYKYIDNTSEFVALYNENYQLIYSNTEKADSLVHKFILDPDMEIYCLGENENKHYMFFTSCWSVNNKIIYIVNGYDINEIYEEKDRQMSEILFTDIIILVVSTIVISIISIFLTKPIDSLNKVSKKIASGEFNERVNIKSKDEIGELANSFNIMAEQIEQRINELNLQVKKKNDFINGFTHELKTPMTAIVGYADLLRLKKCDEELSRKALNYIYSESKRIERLSFKLMELVLLTEEKIELQKIDVNVFMKKIANTEENILANNRLDLYIESCNIIGDSELLEVAIRNLIENASKAEPKDNKIVIRGEKTEKGKYRISVIDRGKGIPEKDIERVTEDFYMVDKSRSRTNGGSGIGLSLVKKILELHNSSIVIESEENIGTKVYFELEEDK